MVFIYYHFLRCREGQACGREKKKKRKKQLAIQALMLTRLIVLATVGLSVPICHHGNTHRRRGRKSVNDVLYSFMLNKHDGEIRLLGQTKGQEAGGASHRRGDTLIRVLSSLWFRPCVHWHRSSSARQHVINTLRTSALSHTQQARTRPETDQNRNRTGIELDQYQT